MRNKFPSIELLNLLHLKAFDCVTVMIHGSMGYGNSIDEIVVPFKFKNKNPVVVLWRNPASSNEDEDGGFNRNSVNYRGFLDWDKVCEDQEIRDLMSNRMILVSTNLDGGSVSIVNNKLGRGITHVAIAKMSDYNNVIQMLGRSFHNQPDVKVLCLRDDEDAEAAVDSPESTRVKGMPVVQAFMSMSDIENVKSYYATASEMFANKMHLNSVFGKYTVPSSNFLKHNQVGLLGAKMTQRVRAQSTLNVPALEARQQWGEEHCPAHVDKLADIEAKAPGMPVFIDARGERHSCNLYMHTDSCAVVYFDKEVSREEYDLISSRDNFDTQSCAVHKKSRFCNGNGSHQPNNCPVYLATRYPDQYRNFWVYNEDKRRIEMRVLTLGVEAVKQVLSFSWIKYDNGEWVEMHHPSGCCQRAHPTANTLLEMLCFSLKDNRVAFVGTVHDFNNKLMKTFPMEFNAIVSERTRMQRQGNMLQIIGGINMRHLVVLKLVEEITDANTLRRVLGDGRMVSKAWRLIL